MSLIIETLEAAGYPTVYLGSGNFSIFLEVDQEKVPTDIKKKFDTPVLCFTREVEKIDFLETIGVETVELLVGSNTPFDMVIENEIINKTTPEELPERNVFWSEKLYPADFSDEMDNLLMTLNWDRLLTQEEVTMEDINKVYELVQFSFDLPENDEEADVLEVVNTVHKILSGHMEKLRASDLDWEMSGFCFDVSISQLMETLDGELRIQDFLIF